MDTEALELAVELVKDVKKKFPCSQRAIRLTVRPIHLHELGIRRSVPCSFSSYDLMQIVWHAGNVL